MVKYYASGWVFRNSEGSHDFKLPEEEFYRRCSRIAVEVQQRIQNWGHFDIHKTLGAFLAANVHRHGGSSGKHIVRQRCFGNRLQVEKDSRLEQPGCALRDVKD